MKKSDMICDRCEGEGIIFERRKKFYEQWESWYENYTYTCPKCHGDGKLDWIENIIGKKVSRKSQTVHHGACLGCKTSSKLCPKCKYYRNGQHNPDLRTPRF